MISFKQAVQHASTNVITSSVPLTKHQFQQLEKLNLFAVHQASNNHEVQMMPAKMIYKVNEEFKTALVAMLTTCAVMDYHRQGRETKDFFENQVQIFQKRSGEKILDFGVIRPDLLERFLIPEIVDDWITYRDVNGDGIHALARKKTGFLGLSGYEKGGDPVYEFVRFYHSLMADKQRKSEKLLETFQQAAVCSLANHVVHQQLLEGHSPDTIMNRLLKPSESTKKAVQQIEYMSDSLSREDKA